MRNVLDFTFKLSDDYFAAYANKINDADVLIIDDVVSRGQTISEIVKIIKTSYAPKSITVLTLLSKLYWKIPAKGPEWAVNTFPEQSQKKKEVRRAGYRRSRCGGEACVEIGEGVVQGLDVIEFVHPLGVVEKSGAFQTVVRVGRRFAAVGGELFEKIDEKSELPAHVNPSSDNPTGADRR